ncbi:MAG: hypothetical protein COA45_10945 [Zetaproteobacteria bacterium]|nr:MAG: hypothetical protein COA45_10945 [Zetaproteobacteria bacterium]
MRKIPFDNSYARLPEVFFALVQPEKAPDPAWIRVNTELADFLELDRDWILSEEGLAMFSGKALPKEAKPIAMAYAGHQFGGWVPRLGDGRALLLGEVIAQDGMRHDIQLKGAGKTPFSRAGDGKSALGPVLREYIVSEAIAALGVPTTRALAAVTTGETVHRDSIQPGAVLTRVAQSHVRIGTFQYFSACGDEKAVKTLADYVIDRHYPEVKQHANPYKALLKEIVERQAVLIAQWMSFGFIHGVMNTDNMQVVGETIDYGPCAFMDEYHPQKVFSSIDRQGRYSWMNQPTIAQWNLARLAETLLFLLAEDQDQAVKEAEGALGAFNDKFSERFSNVFSQKLGLQWSGEEHRDFIENTLSVMAESEVDFTLFFRHLTCVAGGESEKVLRSLFNDPTDCDKWLKTWRIYLTKDNWDQERRVAVMRRKNPIFIPRNHRIEDAIQAAQKGDYKPFNLLVDILKNPFTEQPENAELEKAPTPEEVVHHTFCGT